MRRVAAAAFAAILAPSYAEAASQAASGLSTRMVSLHCEIVRGEAVARNIRGVFIAKGTPVTITIRAAQTRPLRRVVRVAAAFDSLFDREEVGRAPAPAGATGCAATAKARQVLRN